MSQRWRNMQHRLRQARKNKEKRKSEFTLKFLRRNLPYSYIFISGDDWHAITNHNREIAALLEKLNLFRTGQCCSYAKHLRWLKPLLDVATKSKIISPLSEYLPMSFLHLIPLLKGYSCHENKGHVLLSQKFCVHLISNDCSYWGRHRSEGDTSAQYRTMKAALNETVMPKFEV